MNSGQVLESLECPICLELPENEVYQCKNKHNVCGDCSKTLTSCPLCRIPYKNKKTRNRQVEKFLKELKVECVFLKNGCNTKLQRSVIAQHELTCSFRPTEICKLLGYPDCNFLGSDIAAMIQHLQDIHKIPTISPSFPQQIPTVNYGNRNCVNSLGFISFNDETFLLVALICSEGKNISFLSIHFTEHPELTKYEISFEICDIRGKRQFSWTLRPIHLKDVKEFIGEPVMQIPLKHLEMNFSNDPATMFDLKANLKSQPKRIIRNLLTNSEHEIEMSPEIKSSLVNNQMVDNLRNKRKVLSPAIENVMRTVDRLPYEFMYGNMAGKGNDHRSSMMHLSSPEIYATVLEQLDLKPGQKFLNIGSGTGYLSTMCGLLLGSNGLNYGIELYPDIVAQAEDRAKAFEDSLDPYLSRDICLPIFQIGNIFHETEITLGSYDRIYCSGDCDLTEVIMLRKLLQVNGLCVTPVEGKLMKIRRVSEDKFESTPIMSAKFSKLARKR